MNRIPAFYESEINNEFQVIRNLERGTDQNRFVQAVNIMNWFSKAFLGSQTL